jgi:alanine racemase
VAGAVLRLSRLYIADHHQNQINKKNTQHLELQPDLINSHSWVEINQDQVIQNIKKIKQIIGHTSLGVIVKGNAYGHGLTQIVKILQKASEVDWIIAFSLSEAILARKAGFDKKILVCGHVDGLLVDAIKHEIDLVLYDYVSLQSYRQIAQATGHPVLVHIKVDTGLSRLGFAPQEAIKLLLELQGAQDIVVRGLFTHFAESDAPDNWYAKEQLAIFDELLNQIGQLKMTVPVIHLANTVAIFRLPSTHKSLVRVGGGVYGLHKKMTQGVMPQVYAELLPVITWKSKIIQIREVVAGNFVSYGRTFQAITDMRLAVIPVGYADGYGRELSNNSVISVNGILAPVVGRVCMNLTIIDITQAANVAVGDEVVLLGDIDGVRITDLMQRLNTIACDVTTRINWTIPRVLV